MIFRSQILIQTGATTISPFERSVVVSCWFQSCGTTAVSQILRRQCVLQIPRI